MQVRLYDGVSAVPMTKRHRRAVRRGRRVALKSASPLRSVLDLPWGSEAAGTGSKLHIPCGNPDEAAKLYNAGDERVASPTDGMAQGTA